MYRKINFTRTLWFFILVLLGFTFLILKMVGNSLIYDKKLKVQILSSRDVIEDLDVNRNIVERKTIFVDSLNFSAGDELYHENVGHLGFTNDFFLEVESNAVVKQAGVYEFSVLSDDGFRFYINDEVVSEFTGLRRGEDVLFNVDLKEGRIRIKIEYFQGYGQLCLIVKYRPVDDERDYFVGIDTKYIEFNRF